jgi:hypothetical protein
MNGEGSQEWLDKRALKRDELQRQYEETPPGKFDELMRQNAAVVVPPSLLRPHQAAMKGVDALKRLDTVIRWLPGAAREPGERIGGVNIVGTVSDALSECKEALESEGGAPEAIRNGGFR